MFFIVIVPFFPPLFKLFTFYLFYIFILVNDALEQKIFQGILIKVGIGVRNGYHLAGNFIYVGLQRCAGPSGKRETKHVLRKPSSRTLCKSYTMYVL